MFYLAPMQGLTHLPFRKAFSFVFPNTIDFAISPFISLTHGSIQLGNRKFFDVLPENNQNAIPLIPQILGNEARLFVEMANVLYDLGYDIVNWNLGCPMPRVSKKRRGAGLLFYPEEIQQFLEFVLPKLKPKLSIKMRLGYENPTEIKRLIPILNQAEIHNIIMHPRIGVQLYKGDLHLDWFRFFMKEIKHPVIFNGNIFTNENYSFVKENFPQIEDIMLGRGVLHNIFLPQELKGEPISKSKFFLFEEILCSEIQSISGSEEGALSRMKEYWFYFSSLFNNSESYLNKMVHLHSFAEYREFISTCHEF